ncbi:MAG: GAF domain-containing protein [Chloroflexi bacterium]|nr:MAG: GAF domain-containing protein [Chloroflexota bacterium]
MDQSKITENVTLEQALRRANLLAAAAEVSQAITQILDIDELLPKAVDIICDAYDFYYAGVFLLNETGDFAVLRAGRGMPGKIMIENNHKLAVGGNSMIGACTAFNEARISLDVDTEKVWYPNPVLPETRSEMALPLAIGERVIGAVTVQSVEAAAFSDEDVSSLQAMANQLAIALDNAQKQRQLDQAHAELLHAKTFEAIATATGDAIHWIGNKAEPIGNTAERIRQDTQVLFCAIANLLSPEQAAASPLAQQVVAEAKAIQSANPRINATLEKLNRLPPEKLAKQISVNSTLDDLEIIQNAASQIMKVKEELIGPAREHAPRPTMVEDVAQDALSQSGVPAEIVRVSVLSALPLVKADPVQLNRVFVNLLRNAFEALDEQPQPQILLDMQPDPGGQFVNVTITDNGSGIPAEDLDKIWVTFHTTKGMAGHSGLGLPACRLILDQIGGEISAESTPGQGSTFTVRLPVAQLAAAETAPGTKGKGKILIIDNPDRWHRFAAATLSSAGFKVSAAQPGDNFRKPGQYDLILLDDILAGADSRDVIHTLISAGVAARVLVVSSNPRVERTKNQLLLGIKNLLPKPYTAAALLDQVKAALN